MTQNGDHDSRQGAPSLLWRLRGSSAASRRRLIAGGRWAAIVLAGGLALAGARLIQQAPAQAQAPTPAPPSAVTPAPAPSSEPPPGPGPSAQPAPGPPQAQAPVQAPSNPPAGVSQSDAEVVVTLLRTTLVALHQANLTGNYTVLRDLGSPIFRDKNSASDLAAIFASVRQLKIDLSVAVLLDPQLSRAALTKENLLHVAGRLATKPVPIDFELLFQPLGGAWRLDGISITPVQNGAAAAAPNPAPAAPAPAGPQPKASNGARPAPKPAPKPAQKRNSASPTGPERNQPSAAPE